MSDCLAKQVAERLRTWPLVDNTGVFAALARLVEWADVQASGDPYDNDRVSLNAVLRDVAAALGVTE